MNIGWPSISHEFQLITKIDEIKKKSCIAMSTPTATNAATAAKVNEVISCVIPVAIPIWMTGAEQNGYSRRHRLSHLKIYDHLMTNSLKFIINLIIKSEFEYVPSCLPSFLPFLRHSTIRASRGNRRMPNQTHIPRPLHSHFSCQPRTDSGLAATQTQTAIC